MTQPEKESTSDQLKRLLKEEENRPAKDERYRLLIAGLMDISEVDFYNQLELRAALAEKFDFEAIDSLPLLPRKFLPTEETDSLDLLLEDLGHYEAESE